MDKQSATSALASAQGQLLAMVNGFFATDNATRCTAALTGMIEQWVRTEYRQQVSRPGISEEDVAELNQRLGYALDVVNLIASLAEAHGEIVYLRTVAGQDRG